MFLNRVEKLIEEMKKRNLEQMIITSPSYIYYFLGEWIEPGERMLALYIDVYGSKKLIINKLFPFQPVNDLVLFIYEDKDNPVRILSDIILKNKTLGIDKYWPSHFLIELMDEVKHLKVVNSSVIVDEMRLIKDETEKELMRKSSEINDKVVEHLINNFTGKLTEKQMVKEVVSAFEKYEADSISFEPIIAYGPNAGIPHHEPENCEVKEGDSVIFDIGGKYKKYCSDMTRTIFFGEPDEEYKKVYNVVLNANLKAIEKVKPGVKFSDIDKAAREYIESEGYGEFFTHRTGHCIGIDVHEAPNVSIDNDMLLKEGMIFSIEPGIYLPGKTGVRIEDLVLVTKDGCEVLNKFPKDLIIL